MFFLCFLTCLLFTSCLAAEESVKYALLGTSCFFTPDFSGQPDLILWKHDQNKVVEFDVNKEEVYGSYKGRVTLDRKTAELEITELRFEDSGDYELELHINYIIHTSQFKLEVIDKVVKPTISCEKKEDSKTKATLLCSAKPVKPESLMSFKWKSKGLFHHGSKLQITLGDEHDEVEYSCSVSNPLSSETVSFTAKECYNDESSPVPLIVGLVILFLLLLVIALGVFLCKRKQKGCFATHDVEKQSQTKGTGRGTSETEERKRLLERNETLPSHQRLPQGEETASRSDEEAVQEDGTSLPLGGGSTLPSGGDTTPGDHERDPDKNSDSEEAKDTAEEMTSSDQTDSGEKSEPGPADNSQSDDAAAPKTPGYVHNEVDKIDKECVKDGQAPLHRGRESTKSMHSPPSLSPESPVLQDSIHHANINNGDSNVDQSETPEKIKLSDQTNSEEKESGPGVSPQSDKDAAPKPPAAEEDYPSGGDTAAGDHKSNPDNNTDSDSGVENNESEHEDPVSTHLSSTRAELLDNKEENHQHRANVSKHSNEEDSGSFISDVEEQNDPDLADVSPEDEQFGLKAQSDDAAAPKNPGYVLNEVVRIDKVCAEVGQAPLNRGRGSGSTRNSPEVQKSSCTLS